MLTVFKTAVGPKGPGWVRFPYASAIFFSAYFSELATFMTKGGSQLRALPSVSKCLTSSWGAALCKEFGEGLSKFVIREHIEELRSGLKSGVESMLPSETQFSGAVRAELERLQNPAARRAINASGVVLHTGLGRAPMAERAVEAVKTAALYTPVQLDLDTGGRSVREAVIERYLRELTSFEAVTVMTNNAAATFIVLNTLVRGKEVIVSRGQLIEIGGSFRMPDVMAQSGVLLREVGTTNRTHLHDYEDAVNEKTGAILYVEPSNYRVAGFSGTPSLVELCELGKKKGLPVLADLGSGALISLSRYGLKSPMTLQEAYAAGALVSCSSGDKLIGGPQLGIICGKREVIETIRKNPFARMFRPDKLILAAMETTLSHYVNGDFETALPLYQILCCSKEAVRIRAVTLAGSLKRLSGLKVEIHEDVSYIGGGSLPEQALPTSVVSIEAHDAKSGASIAQRKSRELRRGIPPVFARVHENAVCFDMRTLLEGDLEVLVSAILRVFGAAEQ